MEGKNAGNLFVFETKLNGFEGWHYGKGLVYYRPIFLLKKISVPQGQSLNERKYLLMAPKIYIKIYIL